MSRLDTFKAKYVNYCQWSFAQALYLPDDHPGVCRIMCVDWLRRILVQNKMSFQDSSYDGDDRWTEEERMQHKIDKYLTSRPRAYMPMSVGLSAEPVEYRSPQPIPDHSGEEIAEQIYATCEEDSWSQSSLTFYMWGLFKEPKGGGHAMAWSHGDRMYFFDANLGEYLFLEGAEAEFIDFLGDFWDVELVHHGFSKHALYRWSRLYRW